MPEVGAVVLSEDGTYPGIVIARHEKFFTVRWYKWGWQRETFESHQWSPLKPYDGRFGAVPAGLRVK